MRPSRAILFLVVVAAAAGGSLAAAFAVGSGSGASDPATPLPLGGQLEAQMDQAVAAGPYSITCEPAVNGTRTCSPMKDESVIPALRQGTEVWGRTVVSFSGGANAARDSGPMFNVSDLVCSEGSSTVLTCSQVTADRPSVRAGADVFTYYVKHDVTFTSDGRLISHVGAPTIPLRIITGN